MWSVVKLAVGALLILSSVLGTVSFMSGDVQEMGRRIVEGGVDTVGVIEERIEHTVAARRGRIGGVARYYTITYSFPTEDGRVFSGEINVSREQALDARDGQRIRVRYYADQPSINSPLDYEEYMTAEDAENVPVAPLFAATFLFFGGGVWLMWSGWRRLRPAPSAKVRVAPAAPYGAAPRPQAAAAGPRASFGRR